MSECTVPGCDGIAIARGWCRMHYSRVRRGRPLEDERPEPGSPSGCGIYGVLEERDGLMLCHECGRWYRSVGSHLAQGHGITAREYRRRHGIPARFPLLVAEIADEQSERARAYVDTPAWKRLEDARDPHAASQSRTPEQMRRGSMSLPRLSARATAGRSAR